MENYSEVIGIINTSIQSKISLPYLKNEYSFACSSKGFLFKNVNFFVYFPFETEYWLWCVWKGKDCFEDVRTGNREFGWEVEREAVREWASQPVFLRRKRKNKRIICLLKISFIFSLLSLYEN